MSLLNPGLHGIIGGAFGPATLPNIGNRLLWWAADGTAGGSFTDTAATTPAANNSRVAAIKGAEGTRYSQNSTGARPLYLLNRQNSLPGLLFTTARSDNLQQPGSTHLEAVQDATKLTVLVVWKPTAIASVLLNLNDTASDGLRIGTNTTNRIRAYRRGNLSAGNEAVITEAANFAGASAALFVFNGHGSTMVLYDNHGNSNSVAADASEGGTWDEGHIGTADGQVTGFQGDLYELCIWDDAADSTERTDAFAYATSKWGLV
jgi:hypothetical protein